MFDFETLSTPELEQLIAAAKAALLARQTDTSPARVGVTFDSYNEKRYSRPWIARVINWPVGGKPALEWGAYVGSSSGGEVEILARPGDVIRYGQKDNRGNGTTARWAIVTNTGALELISEREARQAYKGA